jgi:hypothetical protein
MRKRGTCGRLGRVLASFSVDVIKLFRLRVIRLQIIVGYGPRRRYPTVVTNLAEIFFTESEQGCPVELGVTPDTIVSMRMQIFAIAILPDLFGLVLAIDVHCARVPIVLLARHEVSTLK